MKKATLLFLVFFLILTVSGCNEFYYKQYKASGVVVDEEGEGIGDVKVSFAGEDEIYTNEDGSWEKSGLEGDTKIKFSKEGLTFDPDIYPVSDTENNIKVKGEKAPQKYDISGNITDKAEDPIEDVVIRFSDGSKSVTTDSEGEWVKEDLSSEVTVTPENKGWEFKPEKRTVNTEEENVNFTGEKTKYEVSGKITYEGEPIPGVELEFSDDYDSVNTDSNGEWKKSGISGEVTITPNLEDWLFTPTNIKVTSLDDKKDDINFEGEPKDNYEYYDISGNILNSDGEGVPGVYLEFKREDGTLLGTAVSDEEGEWQESKLWGTVIVIPDPDSKSEITEFLPEDCETKGAEENIDFLTVE
ncbi:MAG: hypothetical protein ACOC1S_00605 [bacterium]